LLVETVETETPISRVEVGYPLLTGKHQFVAIVSPELLRQTFLLIMLQLNPQNRCPDLVFIKLLGKPKSRTINQIDLYLTINFNEQWHNLIGGRVKLGLKGGELRLRLHNSIVPYEWRQLTGALTLSIKKKRLEQVGSKAQTGLEVGLSDVAVLPAIASKAEAKASVGTEQTQGLTDEFQFTACQITTKGTEENPAWVFASETGTPVLKGLLKNALLGTLSVMARPCHIEASFEVSQRDVYLTDAEGLWPPDISRSKQAVLERMLALRLLESKFKPYLSRTVLHYD